MDTNRRIRMNKYYDWWSAEGDTKLIRIYGPVWKGAISLANQWHEYFLWKPIVEKAHENRWINNSAERAKYWHYYDYQIVFFEPFYTKIVVCSPYNNWGKDTHQYEFELMFNNCETYTIMYKRIVDSPYLQELGKIQDDCEVLVPQLNEQIRDFNETSSKLRAILPKGREKRESAERDILQQFEQLDHYLTRANELRTLILGQS